MNRLTLINFEWTCYSGFVFQFIYIESYKPIDMDGALFGFNISKHYLYIDILFKTFKIIDTGDGKN